MKVLNLSRQIALAAGISLLSFNHTAHAVAISENGLGQALIFPYYTVRDGFESLFNISNVSDETIAVKVRFRESHNSRDVLDFNLVLSPRDVWTGRLLDSANGPVLKSGDKSCTSPLMTSAGFTAQNVGYTGSFSDEGSTSIDRAREGYVEVIMMGRTNAPTNVRPTDIPGSTTDGNPLAYYAKHDGDTPRDCAKINSYFLAGSASGSTAAPLTTASVPNNFARGNAADIAAHGQLASGDPKAREYLAAPCLHAAAVLADPGNNTNPTIGDHDNNAYTQRCLNPLKGNFTLYKSTEGVAGGTDAVAIKNFAEFVTFLGVPTDDLVTAQQYPYFLEPSLASGNGLWSVDNLSNPAIPASPMGDPQNNLLTVLQRSAMINEWANNPTTGAGVDWVVSMPLKNFFVDIPLDTIDGTPNDDSFVDDNFQAAVNSARGYNMAITTTDQGGVLAGIIGPNQPGGGTAGVVTPALGTILGAPNVPAFNTVFQGTSPVTIAYKIYDREEKREIINNTTVSPAPPGTVESLKYEVNVLTFDSTENLKSKVASNVNIPNTLNTPNGMVSADIRTGKVPAIGFAWKTRNFGDSSKNFSQILPHGFED